MGEAFRALCVFLYTVYAKFGEWMSSDSERTFCFNRRVCTSQLVTHAWMLYLLALHQKT